MTLRKLLARDVLIEVNEGSDLSPSWLEIKGVNSITTNSTKNDANTTTFDTDGWLEHITASRGFSFGLGGLRLEDPETGARDPGQEFVEELAFLFTYEAFAPFRITSPGGEVWTFEGSVDNQPLGGGNDDPNAWNVTVNVNGAVTRTPAGS